MLRCQTGETAIFLLEFFCFKDPLRMSLSFGWKQSICAIIHVSFFSSFLLSFLPHPDINFDPISFTPSTVLAPL